MHKLDKVVREYLIESGETNLAKYSRAYQFGVSGLREMNMDLSGVVQIAVLPINSADQVYLPNDYIQYTKIGLVCGDGIVRSLGLNPNINLALSVDNCGNPQAPNVRISNPSGVDILANANWDGFTDNFRNGELMGRFFGIGGGQNPFGYYRIDERNNVIQLGALNSGSPSNIQIQNIVLEYISNLNLHDGDYQVHPFIVESIKCWIHWRMISWNSSRSLGEKEMARKDFFQKRREAKMRYGAATIDEWLSALRSGNFASIKF
jgi:hypothetical protein